MNKKTRVRFAPSPTGYLHIGNARTALFNWLFARKYRGEFILRIEDTDQERSRPEFEKALIEDLHWLGLHWDEGPQQGGNFTPYRQSERRHYYIDAAQQLVKENKAYYCYCTPEELEAQRKELLASGHPPRYQGMCRKLSIQQKQALEKEGRKPSIRFKVNTSDTIIVEDLLRGNVEVSPKDLGDFIIVRSNGIAAYNLAVVVDDAMMEITHVIRGEDHLPNTPRHQLLYNALGYSLPHFVHLPMILGADRTMLSKRHGAAAVSQFRQEGYLPQALVNYLALLGWSPGDEREILSMTELIEAFSIARLAKSAAVFDVQKLNWMNGHYLREADIAHLTQESIPFLKNAGFFFTPPVGKELHWLESVIACTRSNVTKLDQLPQHTEVYFEDNFSLAPEAKQIALEGKDVIKELSIQLQASNWTNMGEPEYKDLLQKVKNISGIKGKKLFMPIRVALSGKLEGPEMKHLFTLLGKERCLHRANNALRAITASE